MAHVYKIQRPDGKFATAGSHEIFTALGRIWTNRAAVKLHLNYSSKHSGYKHCELIEYELKEVRRIPVKEWRKE